MNRIYITVKGKRLAEKISSEIKSLNPNFTIETFNSLKVCKETLISFVPDVYDVLLLGMDLAGENWKGFCSDIREKCSNLKILVFTPYKDYFEDKANFHDQQLISGYISKDSSPEAIISGISAVRKGIFYPNGEIDVNVPKQDQNWEIPVMKELGKVFATNYNDLEKIEKLSQFIDYIDKYRTVFIKNWLAEERKKVKGQQDSIRIAELSTLRLEHLFAKGFDNWEIGDILELNDIDNVRNARMEFVRKIVDKKSIIIVPRGNEKSRILSVRELEILNLTAAGYTNEEICEKLQRSIETVRTHEQNIRDKFGVQSAIEAVTSALRLGIIKLESIEKRKRKNKNISKNRNISKNKNIGIKNK